MNHNLILWVLQWAFGLFFVGFGVLHFMVPEGLPAILDWMYDLDPTLHYVTGAAEMLGGLGLILPGLTGVMPGLTPWAAVGLAAVMVGAMIFHASRGEIINIVLNVVDGGIMVYIAYGRWRPAPLRARI
ncbi:MAG: DoxX family protein [Acidimicrobiia bacterium]